MPLRLRLPVLWALVAVGILGGAVFGYYALVDWAALQRAYRHFEETAQAGRGALSGDLLVAEAKQNIHRINLFAEGVWTLLSALIAAVGLHGLCTAPVSERNGS